MKSDVGVTVLIVNHDDGYRESLSRLLRAEGFDVVGEAGSGAQAIRIAEAVRPVIVLMDIRLPDFSGVVATAEVRKVAPRCRVIAHGLLNLDTAMAMLEAGAGTFVHKTKPENLLAVMRATAAFVALGNLGEDDSTM